VKIQNFKGALSKVGEAWLRRRLGKIQNFKVRAGMQTLGKPCTGKSKILEHRLTCCDGDILNPMCEAKESEV